MKKLILLAFLFVGISANAQIKWAADTDHSSVSFEITHMMISTTEGEFKDFSIELDSKENKTFEGATAKATIQVNSVDTDAPKRDAHLQTEDFFHAEKHPEITFKSKGFEKDSDTEYMITGDLTMHGVTKSVTFEAKLIGVVEDPWGNMRCGWKATSTIDRTEFGMEGSTSMVGTDVKMIVNLEFVQQK